MPDWLHTALDYLSGSANYTYRTGQSAASEPAALAALALMVHGRDDQAVEPLQWLLLAQQTSGSVGVRKLASDPRWPTALAILAWRFAIDSVRTAGIMLSRAAEVLLTLKGEVGHHTRDMIGHDPSIVAWAWVVSTHSWVEPTAFSVMALKTFGLWEHERVREGVRLLLDRQLPSGGCNYGNTTILGQELRAHVQPTGTALTALAGEADDPRTVPRCNICGITGGKVRRPHWRGRCWVSLRMNCGRSQPKDLEQVATSSASDSFATYHWSLLALAAAGPENPFIRLCRVVPQLSAASSAGGLR